MAEQDDTIHVSSAFDKNYLTPFYVLLTSIFHNHRENNIVIHSIATGISEEEKQDIDTYVQNNGAKIIFYPIDEDYVRRNVIIPERYYFTIATYYRLFLPALIAPEVKKLLYIDTDAIVVKNTKELYGTDIGSAPFAAVPDLYPNIRTDLGLDSREKYFNAGVLLIDLENWRSQKVTEDAMRFIVEHPEKIRFVDQDALNGTQKNKWYRLDRKYNITMFDTSLSPETPKKEVLRDAVIIHYSTSHKPWKALGENKLRASYHYYLKKSPHAHYKKYTDFEWNANHVRKFLYIRLLEWYFEHPAITAIYRKVKEKVKKMRKA